MGSGAEEKNWQAQKFAWHHSPPPAVGLPRLIDPDVLFVIILRIEIVIMARRSKRKSIVATRFSARKQARQQGDAEIYGSDYGILPSGGFGCSFVLAYWLALLVFRV